MKVMIAYDGSPCADAALKDLHRAGLPLEAEAFVITVAERWLSRPAGISYQIQSGSVGGAAPTLEVAKDIKDANKLALEAKSRIETYFTNWKVQARGVSGSPPAEILNVAREWMPELIVVGCQGCSGAGAFLLGSVSQSLLNDARCSVRVCRGTAWKNGCPVRLVIGLDGSRSSDEAVKEAARRIWPIGSEVRLLSVRDPARLRQIGQTADFNSEKHEWVRQFVDSAEKELRAVGLEVSSKIEEGDPKQLIVADADEWGADCIMLGAAASPGPSFGLGEVATAVVARAHLFRRSDSGIAFEVS
jgi:nucleotide-binding universal stress UspA family protein